MNEDRITGQRAASYGLRGSDMTREQRIEAAANAYVMAILGVHITGLGFESAARVRTAMAIAVTAAFPEIMSDPPTGWVAPMEATEAMCEAVADMEYQGPDEHVESFEEASVRYVAEEWRAARDAHTKEQA